MSLCKSRLKAVWNRGRPRHPRCELERNHTGIHRCDPWTWGGPGPEGGAQNAN